MTLLRHTSLYLVVRGGSGLIAFLALALYTRVLAPDVYGQYAIVLAMAGLVATALFQWLSLGVVRILPEWEDRREAFLGTVGTVYLVIASGATAVGAVVWAVWPPTPIRGLIPLGVGVVWIQAWYDLTLERLRIELKPGRYGLVALARACLALAVGYGLAVAGFGAAGLLIGVLVGMGVPSAVAALRLWRGIRLPGVDGAALRQLAAYGLPLTATFALAFVVGSSDRILLGWLRDDRAAGLYAVSYDLSQYSVGLLLSVVNMAMYPVAVRALNTHGPEAADRRLRQNGVLLLAAGIPAGVGLMILAPEVADVALGAEFRDTGRRLIPWIAGSMVLSGIRSFHYDLAFQLGRRTAQLIWVMGGAAVVNVLLNLWWIPRYGVMGAAYSTLAAFVVALLSSWWLGRRTFPMPPLWTTAPPIAGSAGIMALVVWVIPRLGGAVGLLLAILVGTVTYGLGLLAFDVAEARTQVRRIRLTLARRLGG